MTRLTRCGRVVVAGRANVGKSTFFNRSLGQKLSITSPRPQTTRHHLVGVKTLETAQIIYIDTPGLQVGTPRQLNRAMNREAVAALAEANVVLMLCEALRWRREDEYVAEQARASGRPLVLGVNKIDLVADKRELLPFLARMTEMQRWADMVPLSSRSGENLERLESVLAGHLPVGDFQFPEDQITDRGERFFASEILREKLTRVLGAEVPYSLGVVIDQFRRGSPAVHILATIWVERPGQKRIVIGRGGAVLKQAGELARKDMQTLFDAPVYLETWVKVREGWADDARALRELGLG